MILYIIRHGDPCYETDTLTPRGVLQAEALSRRLAAGGIDEIYSSPLGRATATAKPTADLLKLDVKIEEWMSEGIAWNELTVINEKGEKDWFYAGQNSNLLKDGEALREDWYNHAIAADCSTAKAGYERIRTESDEFTEKLGYKREGNVYRILNPNPKRVAAFCHGGFGITWLSYLLSIPPLVFWAGFDISHTGVTILNFENNKDGITSPKCLTHSDISHLYGARMPMIYNNVINV